MEATSPVLSSARLAPDALAGYQIAEQRGLECIIGKNLFSPHYAEGKSTERLKVKIHLEDEFVIGGFTEPGGSRRFFGALLLGRYSDGQLRYVGKVGTGFDEVTLESLHRKFQGLLRQDSPFSTEVRERGATFLAPHLVAQISFTEQTKDGKLRHSVYRRLREDKTAREVVRHEV